MSEPTTKKQRQTSLTRICLIKTDPTFDSAHRFARTMATLLRDGKRRMSLVLLLDEAFLQERENTEEEGIHGTWSRGT